MIPRTFMIFNVDATEIGIFKKNNNNFIIISNKQRTYHRDASCGDCSEKIKVNDFYILIREYDCVPFLCCCKCFKKYQFVKYMFDLKNFNASTIIINHNEIITEILKEKGMLKEFIGWRL